MRQLILVLSLIFSVCMFRAMGGGVVDDESAKGDAESSVSDGESVKADDFVAAARLETTAFALHETVIPPENPLKGIFETFFALVAFIPIAVQFLRKYLFTSAGGIAAQLFSWAVGLSVTLIGWLLHLGFLDGLSIWVALLYGVGACLAANGIFDTGLIDSIFNAIFGLFGKNKIAADEKQ